MPSERIALGLMFVGRWFMYTYDFKREINQRDADVSCQGVHQASSNVINLSQFVASKNKNEKVARAKRNLLRAAAKLNW